MKNTVLIRREPVCIAGVLETLVHHTCCGGLVWFSGIVRNENEGKRVRQIEYECHESMAKKELEKIIEEANQKWPVHQIIVIHRIGLLFAGEMSLIIVATAPHRKEAFDCVQFVVDQLKRKVPIWKKEIYESGEAKWLQ